MKGILDLASRGTSLNTLFFIRIALPLENTQNPETLFSGFCYYRRSQTVQQLSDHILAYVLLSIPLYSIFSIRNSAL